MSDLRRRMEDEDEPESLLARFEREDAALFRPIVKMEPACGAEPTRGGHHRAFCSPCGRHVPWPDDAHVCVEPTSPRCPVCRGVDSDHWSAPHLSGAVSVGSVEEMAEVMRSGQAAILRPVEPDPPEVEP